MRKGIGVTARFTIAVTMFGLGAVSSRTAIANCYSLPGNGGSCGDPLQPPGNCCAQGVCAYWQYSCGDNFCGDSLCCGTVGEEVLDGYEDCCSNYGETQSDGHVLCMGLQNGLPCWTSGMCDSLNCKPNNGAFPGTCTAAINGAPCYSGLGCVSTHCAAGICVAAGCSGVVGAPCSGPADCCAPNSCNNGTCAGACQTQANDPCDINGNPGCCGTMACNHNNQCEACVPLNNNPNVTKCVTAADCCLDDPPYSCNNAGVCVTLGPNATCNNQNQCGDPLWTCMAQPGGGNLCQPAGAGVGAMCNLDEDCASNGCINHQCCAFTGGFCNNNNADCCNFGNPPAPQCIHNMCN